MSKEKRCLWCKKSLTRNGVVVLCPRCARIAGEAGKTVAQWGVGIGTLVAVGLNIFSKAISNQQQPSFDIQVNTQDMIDVPGSTTEDTTHFDNV